MAKILAVDDDALARAVLVDALRGMHHEVVPASGGREALERLGSGGFALVITDVMMPEMDGIELARHVARLEKAPPVLLASGVRGADVAAEARDKGVEVAGFVAKPLHADVLSRAISHAMGAVGRSIRAWQSDMLGAPAAATLAEQPAHRFLFLLHRVGASGTLVVEEGGHRLQVVVRNGKIVHLAGVPGLLAAIGVALPESATLTEALEAAVRQGHTPEDAVRAAAQGLGVYIAGLGEEGTLRWEVLTGTPRGAVPLDVPIPRLLAIGFRERRAVNDLLSFWSTVDRVPIRVTPPEDVPEARWGLDMTALRVLRVGARFRTPGEIIAAAVGDDPGRRPDVLRALDFLYRLGLFELSSAAPGAVAPTPEPAVAPSAEAERESDAIAASLQALLAGWADHHPIDVVGLGDRSHVALSDIQGAWRDAAVEVHPDRFKTARADVRAAAAACFDALRAAHEELVAPGGLDDANAFLDARARGVVYVSERSRAAAKVPLRRAEALVRAREWKAADAAILEAMRLDPLTWPIPFLFAWCGWLSRRLSPAESLTLLDRLTPKYPREHAEVHVVRGTILKLEGKAEAALAEFRLAAEKDPNNRDAAREIRLHERRAQPVAPASNNLLENLRSTLTRPIGGAAEPAKPAAPKAPGPKPGAKG